MAEANSIEHKGPKVAKHSIYPHSIPKPTTTAKFMGINKKINKQWDENMSHLIQFSNKHDQYGKPPEGENFQYLLSQHWCYFVLACIFTFHCIVKAYIFPLIVYRFFDGEKSNKGVQTHKQWDANIDKCHSRYWWGRSNKSWIVSCHFWQVVWLLYQNLW